MPSYQEITGSGAIELPAVNPLVTIDGVTSTPLTISCLSAERRMGLTPGQATFRIDKSLSQASPITLNAAAATGTTTGGVAFGSRVTVSIDGLDIWRGWIVRRQDSGERDFVTWTALEDQWLLSKVFMRGCLVWDSTDQRVKYVESFTPQTNPGGLWNCVMAKYNYKGTYYNTYCFAPYAKKAMNYETPEKSDVGEGDVLGGYCAWTPRRFLYYLQFMMQENFTLNIDGIGDDGLRNRDSVTPLATLNINYLRLNGSAITGLIGYDAADVDDQFWKSGVDPLDRKLPDVNFQGMTLASAFDTALKAAGTHDAVMELDPAGYTKMTFKPIRWSGSQTGDAVEIPIQRAGTVSTSAGAYGFDSSEDITNYAERVVVDGAPIKVETRLQLIVDADGVVDLTNSTLVPAWSAAEQAAWCKVVSGRPTAGDQPDASQAAWYPTVPGSTDLTKMVLADGSMDGTVPRPSISSGSPAALNLAMQNYPMVFRAFYLNTAALKAAGVLAGAPVAGGPTSGHYTNGNRWSKLNYNRPLYQQQLQFLLHDLGKSSATQDNWMRGYLPIRLSVQPDSALPLWIDVQYQNGLRSTGDGLLWLDPVSVQAGSNWESILGIKGDSYDNRMVWQDAFKIILRNFAINAAFALDGRVTGVAEKTNIPDAGGWGISPSLRLAFGYNDSTGGGTNWVGKPPTAYFDQVDAYQEYNQVKSQPTPSAKYIGADGTTIKDDSWPLTRIVPPGSERPSAEYQAFRKLRYLNAPRRESSWRLPGISFFYSPGQFITKIVPIGPGVTEIPYIVNAAIPRVVFDFVGQKTELGGLVGEF